MESSQCNLEWTTTTEHQTNNTHQHRIVPPSIELPRKCGITNVITIMNKWITVGHQRMNAVLNSTCSAHLHRQLFQVPHNKGMSTEGPPSTEHDSSLHYQGMNTKCHFNSEYQQSLNVSWEIESTYFCTQTTTHVRSHSLNVGHESSNSHQRDRS